jgi:hypothetical protein
VRSLLLFFLGVLSCIFGREAVERDMGSSRLRQSSLEERYRKCLRISLTFLFSQVGLIGLVVAYSAAGAVLFEWLEADQEIEPRRKILQIRLDCLDDLNRLNRQQFDNNSDELWAIKAGALLKGKMQTNKFIPCLILN